jgi:hexosaminidase
LSLRGCAVIPAPRTVQLQPGEVVLDGQWTLDDRAVGTNHVAVRSLGRDLAEFHSLQLPRGTGAKVIRLAVSPGTVATRSEPGLDTQAYRLRITDEAIEITGNGNPGLFYGVQTFVQMIRPDAAGRLGLPKGLIEDWPRLQLRFLHWDTKHHQDRMETLKRYLDWAARFKANMIGFELEDKFEYPSHPVIGAPGAFSTSQLQEIVNYGLERFIQVVPVIQAPAHMAYVLKHPEFADLRADGNNYQSRMSDPRTSDLIFSMYDDVIKATRGLDYLFVSTDEVYYAGIEGGARPYTPENRSLAWVEFVRRAHDHLAQRGRRMLIWAEYPLLPQHVPMIPSNVIDGVIGESAYIPAENKLGMRQLAYVSMQGEEHLFPNHLTVEGRTGRVRGHLEEASASIATGQHWQGNTIGVFGAAWDDSGLHNETFWLGWSAVAQYGWNSGAAPVDQHVSDFIHLYYGSRAEGLIEIYRLMQQQARAWEATWDRVTSKSRGPGYGNSHGKGQGTARRDLALAPPPLPTLPDLRLTPVLEQKYANFVAEARLRLPENDQLVAALQASSARVDRNRYNLEVFLALARFMGHHWRLLQGLVEAEQQCGAARTAAQADRPAEAVAHLAAALDGMEKLRSEGERLFDELTVVYEMSRQPKGQSVAGRKFVHVLDDTKDHWADRTADLGFMMAPERSLGLAQWEESLREIINAYAKQHGPEREIRNPQSDIRNKSE